MPPTSNAKAAAKELARTWAARPTVYRHYDENEQNHIDIASCLDTPTQGCVGVGTVGLSNHDLGMRELRVELVGSFAMSFVDAANVAATCAFNGFKDGMPIKPDTVHPDVVKLYDQSTTVPHILLTDPFLWQEGPLTLTDGELKIAWLMMIPISDSELAFANGHGFAKLTDLFEQHQIDIFDLKRLSVVL
jgi:antitoxin YqcF